MKKIERIGALLLTGILLSLSLLPVESSATEVIVTHEGDYEYVLVTFEGYSNNELNLNPSGSGMYFHQEWVAKTTGPFINPPSGISVAMWWTGGNSALISFEAPVCSVNIYYASVPDVTLVAFNAEGTILQTNTGASNYDGGPTLNKWDSQNVAIDDNAISMVQIIGFSTQTYIDDIMTCRLNSEVPIDVRPGNNLNLINLKSNAIIPVAVLSTEDFDATDIDVGTVVFGPDEATADHLKHLKRDVNKDGLDDSVFHFRTNLCGFLEGDTEATLRGETYEGYHFFGSDTVSVK